MSLLSPSAHGVDLQQLADTVRDTVRPIFLAYPPLPSRVPQWQTMDYGSKTDGSWVSEVDHRLDRGITEALRGQWPEIPLLSEEQDVVTQQQRLINMQQGCWVLDPLDGTSNFLHGIPMYCVSLALVQGGQVVQGIVYDPNRDELFSASLGDGATCNGESIHSGNVCTHTHQAIAVVDYKRLSKHMATQLMQAQPFYSQRNFGSVALEWCWLACGRVNAYIHGGQKLWDYAAGELIAREAGILALDFNGQPSTQPRNTQPSLSSRSALGAETPELMQQLQTLLANIK